MSIWSRMMSTIKAAQQAWVDYKKMDIMPTDPLRWDLYPARALRYGLYEHYYNNNVYFDPALKKRIQERRPAFYKHIRGVYNPANRLTKLYVSKIYGGALDLELLRDGAIPIEQADETLRDAIRQLWLWSNWNTQKSVYARCGALFGDSFIKLVDDPLRQQVRLEVLDPRKVVDVKFDAVHNVKEVTIEYDRFDEETGRRYTYTEIITGGDDGAFVTLRDGEEYAYFTDAGGKPVSRWPNEYGFVPLVHTSHVVTGLDYGENCFHSALDKINEVNDQASLLNDQVRKVINPFWFVAGADGKIAVDGGDRDTIPTVTAPAGSTATAMVVPLDIANTSLHIQNLLEELEQDMPELALKKLRDQQQVSAPGVQAAFSDAVGRIEEAQGNYDSALVRAHQMGVSIGALRRYEGFTPYTLNSYDQGKLDHFITLRPVIADSLSKQERLTILQSAGVSKRLILQELDYPEDVIEQELADEAQKAAQATRQFAESVFGRGEDDEADTEAEPVGVGGGAGAAGSQRDPNGGQAGD
jgi:hypothetical protein